MENPVFLWKTPVDPFGTFRFFSMQTGFFSFLFPVENGSGKPFFGAFYFVGHPQPGGANFFGKRPEKNRQKWRGRQTAGGSCHRLCVWARGGQSPASVHGGARVLFPRGGTTQAFPFSCGGLREARRVSRGRAQYEARVLFPRGGNNTSVPLFVRRAPGGRGVFSAGGRNTGRVSFPARGRGREERSKPQRRVRQGRVDSGTQTGEENAPSSCMRSARRTTRQRTHVPAAAPWMATCRLPPSGRAAENFFKRAFPFPRIRLPMFGTFAGLLAHPAIEDF